MQDQSKRAETVNPLHDEHCARSEMNDIELIGETDGKKMEDGETGFDDGSAPVHGASSV